MIVVGTRLGFIAGHRNLNKRIQLDFTHDVRQAHDFVTAEDAGRFMQRGKAALPNSAQYHCVLSSSID